MTSLALEFVSVFGLSPVAFVEMAARLGCQHVTTVLQPFRESIVGHPPFSLREDKALRRELIAAMRDTGVSLSSGDGIAIMENADVRDMWGGDLDIMHELGIPRINVVSLDPDLPRTFDQFATLTEMAGERGIETLIEFVPIFSICDLDTALKVVAHVGRADCRIMFDTMHFCRSGGKAADLAAVDPQAICYVQLCDVPLVPVIADYMDEAISQRAVPGEGDLPLLDILRALPRNRVVGLEIPLRSQALAGVGDEARMARCVDATRALLAQM